MAKTQSQPHVREEARGPGRPTNAEVKENPPKAAEFVMIPVKALVCPCCGRGMSPRVIKTDGENKKLMSCTLCGGRFTAIFEKNQPATVREV